MFDHVRQSIERAWHIQSNAHHHDPLVSALLGARDLAHQGQYLRREFAAFSREDVDAEVAGLQSKPQPSATLAAPSSSRDRARVQ